MRSFEFLLLADYFQFYLQDEAVSGDLSRSWDDAATARLLAIAPGTIGVGTVRNMNVPVLLEVHDEEPEDDSVAWDHVVECGLDVTCGRIVIAGCTDYFPDAARIEIPPGYYRARVSYGAIAALSENHLDGSDHYRVQLWRGTPIALRVLKQR